LTARNGRPIRLLVVGVRWPPETFIQRKLERLAEQGFDVRVASFVPRNGSAPRLGGIGFERLFHWEERGLRAWLPLARAVLALLVREPSRFVRLLSVLRGKPKSKWRLYASLGCLRADVFHVEWLTVADACAPVFELWDAPVVLSCHGRDLHGDPYVASRARLAARLPDLFRQANVVHCVSQALRREAVHRGLDPGKARLITPAVDAAFFRPSDDRRPLDGCLRLVGTGWFRWLKGWEYALLTIAELVRDGIPVSFAVLGGDPPGDPPATERRRLLYTIADLGLADHVSLEGAVDPDQLRGHLQRADVFFHASLIEGLPNVVLEAMACGLPVVATDVGGTREAVTDGVEGLVVPPREPRAAMVALARLWRDPALRARMGAAARSRIERDFTLDEQTRRYEALYREVVARG
jgi:colanic acid/amylovoran biosynthesis glycosyltransferase